MYLIMGNTLIERLSHFNKDYYCVIEKVQFLPGIIRVFIDERGNNSLGNFVNWIKVKIFVDSVHCNLKVLFKIQCFQDWVLEMQILYQKVYVLLMENFLSAMSHVNISVMIIYSFKYNSSEKNRLSGFSNKQFFLE